MCRRVGGRWGTPCVDAVISLSAPGHPTITPTAGTVLEIYKVTPSVGNRADQARVDRMSSSERHPPEPSLLPLRILLAEDNPVNLKLAIIMLKRLGYRADSVSNGQEALDALAKQEYDVVLMDVQMPIMDGLEATREVRRRWPGADCPSVIGMTANALTGFRERCIEAGMIDYISKPVVPEELKAALSRAAQTRRPGVVQARVGVDAPSGELSEFFDEMIQPFIADAARSLDELRELLAEGNAVDLGGVAHRLKGGCQIVGAREMAEICEELEDKGLSGSTTGAEELIAHLEVQFRQLRTRSSE
jgi:CheY-like chemotaxis protein/HPt (histidine-containing phosphotransfer) domain-containing protein